jgi:lipid A disaccharide synthetase
MVAGEASGDLLASRLLSGLRPCLPEALMHGIGGPKMAEYGFISHWPMEKLAVRGLFEVLAHYREIKGIQDALRDRLLAERPAVFIGVDAPDFNFGLERRLKESGIPTVHFIGPSIWAWRGARIKKIARAVSHMLVIFPFEEEIYRKAGIPATYVGHPLAEVIPLQPDGAAARASLGLPAGAPVVAIILTVLGLLATPITAAISRVAETNADRYSLEHVNEPDGLSRALVKTIEYRAATPSALEEVLFYDHPAVGTRVRRAMDWKAAHPPAAPPSQNSN